MGVGAASHPFRSNLLIKLAVVLHVAVAAPTYPDAHCTSQLLSPIVASLVLQPEML
jgi:hypothetical protein